MELSLEAKIEALLFYKAEPTKIEELSELLDRSVEEINNAIYSLERNLEGRGISIMRKEGDVQLASSSEVSEIIEKMRQKELNKDIGNAGKETLSIVLYRGPVSRAEIDYIRGVNSASILRNLLIRGLVEKTLNPKNKRSYLYQPTMDLLSFLGIKKVEDLPGFEETKRELDGFFKTE